MPYKLLFSGFPMQVRQAHVSRNYNIAMEKIVSDAGNVGTDESEARLLALFDEYNAEVDIIRAEERANRRYG